MHKPGKQPWRWLIILTTSLAIIFATIPASYKCLKCMNCGRRSLNDHEACCTWDKWPIQSHRPRSDYGNRPGVVKFVMIRNAHAENYEFVSFPEMRTSAITMKKRFFFDSFPNWSIFTRLLLVSSSHVMWIKSIRTGQTVKDTQVRS